jgi:molybdopterin molybdotransferase
MALQSFGFSADICSVKDDLDSTLKTVSAALKNSDVVFLSGGISVGKYDYVHEVLERLDVQQIFYKVKQKPGKPLYFGIKENTIVFGLPGNPAAALTSFYIYGLRAIAKKIARKTDFIKEDLKKLTEAIEKPANKTFFLKGKINEDKVEVLPGQSSAMLGAFSDTDCFILLNQDKTNWRKGDNVRVLKIQQ